MTRASGEETPPRGREIAPITTEGIWDMAKVKEGFTAYIRMGKEGGAEPVEFQAGEDVEIVKVWEGELALIKNSDGKLFNIKKTLLEMED